MAISFPAGAGANVDHGDVAAIDSAAGLVLMLWGRIPSFPATTAPYCWVGKGLNLMMYTYGSTSGFSRVLAIGQGGSSEARSANNVVDNTGAWRCYGIRHSGLGGPRTRFFVGNPDGTYTFYDPVSDNRAANLANNANPLLVGNNTGTIDGPGIEIAHLKIWSQFQNLAEMMSEDAMVNEFNRVRMGFSTRRALWVPYWSTSELKDQVDANDGTLNGSPTTVEGPPVMIGRRRRVAGVGS